MAVEFLSSPANRRIRHFLKDRADPNAPFQVLRNRRRGFLPEWTPSHKGQVYVASCDGLKNGVYKIGKSTDHFSKRSQALSHPTGVPGFYFPVYRMESDHFDQLEKDILGVLGSQRLHRRKEFVECPLEEIVKNLRARQKEWSSDEAFTEHFYYPIEEFEDLLEDLYHDFLVHPSPVKWPRICIFLSLVSGLSPTDVLIRVSHQGEELPFLIGGPLLADDLNWLIHYLRTLMHHDYLPFGREMTWDLSLQNIRREDRMESTEETGSLENEDFDLEKYLWYYDWLEEFFWDAICSSEFLKKILKCTDSYSTENFCLVLHRKACQYLGIASGRNDETDASLQKMRRRLDFHFI